MIKQFLNRRGNVLGFQMSGRLHDADYAGFVPLVDAAIARYGRVRILIQFEDFEGWDAVALWDDFKFTTARYTEIERFAMVGEASWERQIVRIGKLFSGAEVRYFRSDAIATAWAWLEDGAVTPPGPAVEADLPGLNPGVA